jgi:hypothetical protein
MSRVKSFLKANADSFVQPESKSGSPRQFRIDRPDIEQHNGIYQHQPDGRTDNFLFARESPNGNRTCARWPVEAQA